MAKRDITALEKLLGRAKEASSTVAGKGINYDGIVKKKDMSASRWGYERCILCTRPHPLPNVKSPS